MLLYHSGILLCAPSVLHNNCSYVIFGYCLTKHGWKRGREESVRHAEEGSIIPSNY